VLLLQVNGFCNGKMGSSVSAEALGAGIARGSFFFFSTPDEPYRLAPALQ
jgi:hypothetical protein